MRCSPWRMDKTATGWKWGWLQRPRCRSACPDWGTWAAPPVAGSRECRRAAHASAAAQDSRSRHARAARTSTRADSVRGQRPVRSWRVAWILSRRRVWGRWLRRVAAAWSLGSEIRIRYDNTEVGIYKKNKKEKRKKTRFRPRKNDNGQEKKKENALSTKKVRFKKKRQWPRKRNWKL